MLFILKLDFLLSIYVQVLVSIDFIIDCENVEIYCTNSISSPCGHSFQLRLNFHFHLLSGILHSYFSLWSIRIVCLQCNISLQQRSFQLKERQAALDKKIQELTEKEELLNYFVRQNELALGLLKGKKPRKDLGEVDDVEYVAEPGQFSLHRW